MKLTSVLVALAIVVLGSSSTILPALADSENKYVDSYDGTYTAWIESGTSPYLHDDEASNVIYTNTANALEGYFTFSDTTFTTVTDVHLWVKAKASSTYPDDYVEVYNSTTKIGELTLFTTSYVWYQVDVSPFSTQLDYLDTIAEVNAFQIYFKYIKVGPIGTSIFLTCAYIAITGSAAAPEEYYTVSNLAFDLSAHATPQVAIFHPAHLSITVAIRNAVATAVQTVTHLPIITQIVSWFPPAAETVAWVAAALLILIVGGVFAVLWYRRRRLW